MPFVWCLGSILGPAIGGALAQPVKSYPAIFPRGSVFDTYPFLLSNLVCVVILCCGFMVGVLFLHETHSKFRDGKDFGISLGNRLLAIFKKSEEAAGSEEDCGPTKAEEKARLLSDEASYRDSESSSRRSSVSTEEIIDPEPVAAPKAFSKSVIMNIVAYGLIAYHAISFDQMMPIFLSSPVSDQPASSFLKFTGGFGYSSQFVGLMLAVQGVYSMFAQIILFPYAIRRWGALNTFRTTIMVWPLLYIITPYVVFLPTELQTVGIMFCLTWRITAQCLSFPTMQILITNSAPSMLVLGLINGIAASTASLARAFGPTLSGSLFSFGLSIGYVGLAWWIVGAISIVGAVQSFWMTEDKGRLDVVEDDKTPEALEQQ